MPSSVPRSFSYAGSQNHLQEKHKDEHLYFSYSTYGSLTRTRPWIDTRACNNEDRVALHVSFLSPAQVPRIDKQTFPSSYRFLCIDIQLGRIWSGRVLLL